MALNLDVLNEAGICGVLREHAYMFSSGLAAFIAFVTRWGIGIGKNWTISLPARLAILTLLGFYLVRSFDFLRNMDGGRGPFADPNAPIVISLLFLEIVVAGGLALALGATVLLRDREKKKP